LDDSVEGFRSRVSGVALVDRERDTEILHGKARRVEQRDLVLGCSSGILACEDAAELR
jgi:hypothetical protein